MRARLRPCFAVALVLLASAKAGSADAPPPTRLEYHAPASCPPGAEFEKRLRARAPRVRLVPSGAAPRTIYVDIVHRADGMLGTLRIVDGSGGDRRRSLKAARCDDTVDGLALVAAVALDPDSPLSSPDHTDSPPPPPAPLEVSGPTPTPSANRPESPPAPPTPPTNAAPSNVDRGDPAIDLEARSRRPPSNGVSLRFLAGIGAGGLFGHAPGALPAFMFLLGAEWFVSPFWSPSLRASLIQTGEREFTVTGGVVRFRATMGMIEACPFRFGPTQLAFRPCLAGDGGVATISGENTIGRESHPTWRWHLGASGLMALGVSKSINVTAAAGLLFPSRRDQVAFQPIAVSSDRVQPIVVFYDPAVSEFVRLDLTLAFP